MPLDFTVSPQAKPAYDTLSERTRRTVRLKLRQLKTTPFAEWASGRLVSAVPSDPRLFVLPVTKDLRVIVEAGQGGDLAVQDFVRAAALRQFRPRNANGKR